MHYVLTKIAAYILYNSPLCEYFAHTQYIYQDMLWWSSVNVGYISVNSL